jgi:hypothetical protein
VAVTLVSLAAPFVTTRAYAREQETRTATAVAAAPA